MHELEYPSTLGEGNEISVFDENIKYNGCAVITDLIKRGKLKQGFDWFDDITDMEISIIERGIKENEICDIIKN